MGAPLAKDKTEANSAGYRGTALIVDDGATNRLVLKSLLSKRGFNVAMAEDGIEAVEAFKSETIDIVFMDVMMPNMDGYEATRIIKALSREKFVPVIFLTGMTDEEALANCIDAGGDDFLTKPFSHTILESKIAAMERIRSLNHDVNRMVNHMQREEEFAEQVFSKAVMDDNIALDVIHSVLCPASTFSGDMMLTAYTPSGDIHVLLGDFTGHGLGAALGALPASEVFRTMSEKGFSSDEILDTINDKLHKMLPVGMFMAAQFIRVSNDLSHVSLCNCGMPEILHTDQSSNTIKNRFPSTNLALGITGNFDAKESIVHLQIDRGDHFILSSDGSTEAMSPSEEYFGQERFEHAIMHGDGFAIDRIATALDQFCGAAEQADDISLVEVPCCPDLIKNSESIQPDNGNQTGSAINKDDIALEVKLCGSSLNQPSPIPTLIAHLQSISSFDIDREALFTVLTELYVNALDHGILGLDSALKSTPEGFGEYFNLRETRLQSLDEGHVAIRIHVEPINEKICLVINIEDTGNGFDFEKPEASMNDNGLCGRGIPLIQEFSDSLTYHGNGNAATVIFPTK